TVLWSSDRCDPGTRLRARGAAWRCRTWRGSARPLARRLQRGCRAARRFLCRILVEVQSLFRAQPVSEPERRDAPARRARDHIDVVQEGQRFIEAAEQLGRQNTTNAATVQAQDEYHRALSPRLVACQRPRARGHDAIPERRAKVLEPDRRAQQYLVHRI